MFLLRNLGFFARTRLKLVSRVLPVKRTEIVLLDDIEIGFGKPSINQVDFSPLIAPRPTDNLCPDKPEAFPSEMLRAEVLVEDLTTWLGEEWSLPEIELFPVDLQAPRILGKSYGISRSIDAEQPTLFSIEDPSDCKHGVQTEWCSTCTQEAKARVKVERTTLDDLFDLILPLLQPPLGDQFDSPIAFPPGKELYPFQREGVKFLAEHDNALLGDEMGLGKSIQAIIALRFLLRMGKVTTAIILCPKSVLTDWQKKLWEWAPELRVMKISGTVENRSVFWNSPAHIYLVTYETFRQDALEHTIAKTEFSLIILDEIQSLKNPGAEKSRAVRGLQANIRWGLSGTPLENRVEELVAVFAHIKSGLLRYDDASRPAVIKHAIKPYFLRRRKADALSLPEKVHEEAWLELTPTQKAAYDRAEREGVVALNEHGDAVTIQHVLALITKLKQICNRDPVTGESCKLEYLKDKLQKADEQGDKALVFSQYPDKTLRFIAKELQEYNPLIYHGGLSDSQRDGNVNAFQDQESNKVLLISVRAGGLGLTLTRANYVFHYDLWWNPATAAQAEDRAHRIGQRKTVFVTTLLAVDTIEERIQNLLKQKRELFKIVVDDLSDTNLSSALSEEELFGLFNIQKASSRKVIMASEQRVTEKVLGRVSAEQFEQLVAGLFERMGYLTRRTQLSKDGGVDVYAQRAGGIGTEFLAVQCKHYLKGVVGVEHARALYGVIEADPHVTKGILVTSGDFSQECKEFAQGKRLELLNGVYVSGLLEKYRIPVTQYNFRNE